MDTPAPAPAQLPIRFQPLLPLALLRDRAEYALPFPLDEARVRLTFSGTAALYQGVRALGLPTGSGVLCPSYNCGHEIEPLLRLGLRPDFYAVRDDLGIDIDELQRRLRPDTRALLVTHYFGIGQPLAELRRFCDRHRLRLIEDCAHALLSDNDEGNLGRSGDVAIFSVRKSVPVPNGGAVLFNDPALQLPDTLQTPPRWSTAFKLLELVTKSVLQERRQWTPLRGWAAMAALAPLHVATELLHRLHPRRDVLFYNPDDERFDFAQPILGWRMAPLSETLLHRIDWSTIAARRRANYLYLAQRLAALPGCRVLRPTLATAACPLFLPVAVAQREAVLRHLVQHKLFAASWWEQSHPSVTWGDFPAATRLKAEVLVLPVHQDLTPAQLDHIVQLMAACPALTAAPG